MWQPSEISSHLMDLKSNIIPFYRSRQPTALQLAMPELSSSGENSTYINK